MPTDDDRRPTEEPTPTTRRDVLRKGAALGFATTTAGTTTAETETSEETAIPAPFDQLPTIDDPTDREREHANKMLPPRAVPDEGAIPDHTQQRVVEDTVTVPAWALEAVRWRLGGRDPDETDRQDIRAFLAEYAAIREEFRTPGGQNATEVLYGGHK